MLFRFLGGNKPDKVNRDSTKLNEKAGGLGMIDIKDFWSALKFSWFRRVLNTSAFWPKILEMNVSKIMGMQLNTNDILNLGPSTFQAVGKKMDNLFWREIFVSLPAVMQGALFCSPEKILQAPFWGNPAITRNNKPIKNIHFPMLSSKINTLSDFFEIGIGLL